MRDRLVRVFLFGLLALAVSGATTPPAAHDALGAAAVPYSSTPVPLAQSPGVPLAELQLESHGGGFDAVSGTPHDATTSDPGFQRRPDPGVPASLTRHRFHTRSTRAPPILSG